MPMNKLNPSAEMLHFFRNCRFKFKCYKSWDDLERTDNPAISFCGDCKKNVYYCETPEELNFAIAKNLCVAIRHDHPKAAHRQLSLGSVIDQIGRAHV